MYKVKNLDVLKGLGKKSTMLSLMVTGVNPKDNTVSVSFGKDKIELSLDTTESITTGGVLVVNTTSGEAMFGEAVPEVGTKTSSIPNARF